ncbi:hypothetical protein A8L48_05745 [Rhizobium rhizogenes]|nr:hypothetical protein B0909_16130 [Rhizobium rhizogenes]OAM61861.1 hypothetical protein A8L48_05745 [Rhizobium rhizogenes]
MVSIGDGLVVVGFPVFCRVLSFCAKANGLARNSGAWEIIVMGFNQALRCGPFAATIEVDRLRALPLLMATRVEEPLVNVAPHAGVLRRKR